MGKNVTKIYEKIILVLYNANFEKNTDLESRQDTTERKVEINSLRISNLEDTSKNHSKQISKLLAQ